jgi:hypothetical protein
VNRRLRLALLLAALAAAGPSAAATQTFDATRAQVSIAWLRTTPASRPQVEIKRAGLKTRRYSRPVTLATESTVVLPDTLRVHSLFQRPPPLYS